MRQPQIYERNFALRNFPRVVTLTLINFNDTQL